MWSDYVVMHSPVVNDLSRFIQIPEPMLVQATVPELAVETFHKGILCRLAWLNKVQLRTCLLAPEEHGLRRHLRAVITDDGLGQTTILAQFSELAGHVGAGDRDIDQLPNTFPRMVIIPSIKFKVLAFTC